MRASSWPVILLAMVPISLSLLPSPDIVSVPGMRANRVLLFRASPFEVRPGDTVTLDGSGFSKTSNSIYFNGGSAIVASSTNGSTIRVSVPSGLTLGQYKLSVSNTLGSSDNPDISVLISVTNNPQLPPEIKGASISGENVTLVGSGFTSSNNIITTLGNSSSPLSSSGNTLTFNITSLSLYNQIKNFTSGKKYRVVLWIYVQNEHGINKDPYRLDISI